ncbi:MAG: hypothetical protein M3Z41_06945 [Candidatus Eremiobacteraeota bacterium]|nr:hypothetical protein [Candidatus Eremiobacteraeota bacterium]
MQLPAATQPDLPQLHDLCGQFEQVLIASLVPASLFQTTSAGDAVETADATIESGQSAMMFSQAFAVALERAGGLGLGREMYQLLVQARR